MNYNKNRKEGINSLYLERYFKYYFSMYIIYWFGLIFWFLWILYYPNLFKIICFIIGLSLQIFNTTKIKKIKDRIDLDIKKEIIDEI